MTRMDFHKTFKENKIKIDQEMSAYFEDYDTISSAMKYATDSGKRIRATLYLETLKMLGKEINDSDIKFALALEMIHAYSLVHDDLPAMDDDTTRRGKPTVHIEFGEDIAILTGDALLNEASRLIFALAEENPSYAKAGAYVFARSGHRGMIEGQVLDLHRPDEYSIDYVLKVYEKKTADLFRAAVVGAGLVACVDQNELDKLSEFATNLGYAFQIQDDLLEDTYKDELNILNVLSFDQARQLLIDINEKAKTYIADYSKNDFLIYLTDYLLDRDV